MEAGDHHNPVLLKLEEYAVGEAPHSGAATLPVDDRKLQGMFGNCFNRGFDRFEDRFENRFEAYRSYGDNALFVSGVFPASLKPRRSSRRSPMRRTPARTVDGEYYVTTGKTMYRMAANDSGAPATREPETLLKLAEHFEIYVDALNEMSERYIVGFDMDLIADKMLDNFNRYRETGEERSLDQARRYASLLRIDGQRFSSLFPPD